MSFVQQEQLGSGKRFVEMFSHPWIQKGITRSKDDADGPIKGLEDRQALCIRLQRCLQVTRQGDESREGARCVCKLVQNYWQQCSLLRSPRAELFPLPSEEPLGRRHHEAPARLAPPPGCRAPHANPPLAVWRCRGSLSVYQKFPSPESRR